MLPRRCCVPSNGKFHTPRWLYATVPHLHISVLTVYLSIGSVETTKILVLRIQIKFYVFANVSEDVLSHKDKW